MTKTLFAFAKGKRIHTLHIHLIKNVKITKKQNKIGNNTITGINK
ncbi:hypothetical protein SAMN02583745_02648 [Thorsellia anophelis DSM 18579]|uniref:Uncharacterized protein n=1 Tax=Thorsellia anophelis DSM 18579 TaxID=1123402 RepID=A0A1I0F580_9GAMM|nr:hypothetical protein SAMN02583745_02648 [Thorsellia anophelis DSM 18579]